MPSYTVTFTADSVDLIALAGYLEGLGAADVDAREKGARNTGAKTAAVFEGLAVRPILSRAEIAAAAGCSPARVAEVINESKMTHTPEQALVVASYLSAVADAKSAKVAAKAAAAAEAAKVAKAEAPAEAPKAKPAPKRTKAAAAAAE